MFLGLFISFISLYHSMVVQDVISIVEGYSFVALGFWYGPRGGGGGFPSTHREEEDWLCSRQ